VEEELGWQRVKIGDQIRFEFSVKYNSYNDRTYDRWISAEEVSDQHSHSSSNALAILAYPFLGGVGFMALCRVLYSVLWSRQRIASVRQRTRFDSHGISMGKGKSKRERELV
jgi:hypothetical protein